MVSKTVFQLVVLAGCFTVMSITVLGMSFWPEFDSYAPSSLKFAPKNFELPETEFAVNLSLLSENFFQGRPTEPKTKQEEKSKLKKKKLLLPSSKLKIEGILIDLKQPEKAAVRLNMPAKEVWLGIGDPLPGEFNNWKLLEITEETVVVKLGLNRDTLHKTEKN